jgi:hypothetical protein
MSEDEVAWPTGMSDQDPGARDRPLVFNPQGFMVAILQDADQAEQARAPPRDRRSRGHDRDAAVRCLVGVLLYLDLRARKERLDLNTLKADLQASAA